MCLGQFLTESIMEEKGKTKKNIEKWNHEDPWKEKSTDEIVEDIDKAIKLFNPNRISKGV